MPPPEARLCLATLPESGLELSERPIDIRPRNHQRWRDADRVQLRVLAQDAAPQQRLASAARAACIGMKLDGQHQAAPADLFDRAARNGPQALKQIGALLRR